MHSQPPASVDLHNINMMKIVMLALVAAVVDAQNTGTGTRPSFSCNAIVLLFATSMH